MTTTPNQLTFMYGSSVCGTIDRNRGHRIRYSRPYIYSGGDRQRNTLNFTSYGYPCGSITFAGDTAYTCPLTGGSSCTGSPPACTAPASCTQSYSYGDPVVNPVHLRYPRQSDAGSGRTGHGEQNTTTMTMHSLGKKRSMTDPDMGYWNAYDKAGNLISQTDANPNPPASPSTTTL